MQLSEKSVKVVATTLNSALDFEDAIARFKSGTSRQAMEGEPTLPNLIHETIQTLKKIADEEGVDIAIVGGAASAYHGYPRSTKDIDIAVTTDGYNKLLRAAYKYGFDLTDYNPHGMSTVTYKGVVPVEILEEGMFSSDPHSYEALPSPKGLGVDKGLGFASLPSWIRLKIVGGRLQDQADIVNVLKSKSQQEKQQIGEYLYNVSSELYSKFENLLKMAEHEQQDATKRTRFK